MLKNSIIHFLFLPLICSKSEITTKKTIKYSGIILPPGFYRIAIWDKFNVTTQFEHKCQHLFKYVTRKGKGPSTKKYSICFFKNFEGIELAHFGQCFENFFTALTNENGEFEVELFESFPETINVQLFPVDKNKDLIHSDSVPSTFLQNLQMKTNWKNGLRQTFFFHYLKEKKGRIVTMLKVWQNAKPSDENAFFLRAYLQEIASRIVVIFTNGGTLTKNEVDILNKYSLGLQEFGILENKLAEIDGMPSLVKSLCNFLLEEFGFEGTDGIPHKFPIWHLVCTNYLDKMPHVPKILEGMNFENLETNDENV
ncbi:hypothetical protein GPALN_010131 [Globodera pallida]|nr:hypothetical protein GPALN_010131 [Globodera pallida]